MRAWQWLCGVIFGGDECSQPYKSPVIGCGVQVLSMAPLRRARSLIGRFASSQRSAIPLHRPLSQRRHRPLSQRLSRPPFPRPRRPRLPQRSHRLPMDPRSHQRTHRLRSRPLSPRLRRPLRPLLCPQPHRAPSPLPHLAVCPAVYPLRSRLLCPLTRQTWCHASRHWRVRSRCWRRRMTPSRRNLTRLRPRNKNTMKKPSRRN